MTTHGQVSSIAEPVDRGPPVFAEFCHLWRRRKGLHRNYPLLSAVMDGSLPVGPSRFALFALRRQPLRFRLAGGRADGGGGQPPPPVGPSESQVAADLEEVMRNGRPMVHAVAAVWPGGQARYRRLTLPLSDDGAEVDWLLTVAEGIAWDARVMHLPPAPGLPPPVFPEGASGLFT